MNDDPGIALVTSEAGGGSRAADAWMAARSASDSLPVLIAANLVPVLGVLFLGWDLATILVLYWIENGIVGILNVPKVLMARGPMPAVTAGAELEESMLGVSTAGAARVMLAPFFLIHYGMFWLVHGIFGQKPGGGQPRTQIRRRDLEARADGQAGRGESIGVAEARQERARGEDDQRHRARRQGVEGAGTRRRDLEVGRQPTIRVDLQGGARQHAPRHLVIRQAFERRQEEPGVTHHLLHVGVGRHDEHGARVVREARDVKRQRGRSQARERPDGPVETSRGGGRLEPGSKGERCSGTDHVNGGERLPLTRSSMLV